MTSCTSAAIRVRSSARDLSASSSWAALSSTMASRSRRAKIVMTVVNEIPANQAPHPGSAVSIPLDDRHQGKDCARRDGHRVADVRATQAVTTHNPIQHRFDDCACPRNTRALRRSPGRRPSASP